MTLFYDRATISGGARITPEGYFVADALVARANNVQEYRASELGLNDRDPNSIVRVFRPESEVFAADSVRTAVRLPITLDHPVKNGVPVMVDATNWKEFAGGQTGEDVLRDGEFLRVPLRITDADAVRSVKDDRQEFSLGYSAKIKLESGTFADQAYDAVLSDIRYNHLAACVAARGGSELRIVDERPPVTPAATGANAVKNILVDGLPVNVADAAAAEATISKLLTDRAAAQADVQDTRAKLSTAETTIAARDAEIVGLKDELGKAKLSPQALRDAAASYARTVATAKALGATVTDAMDEPAARKAAVVAKLGDKAAAYNDEQVATAFDVLAAQLPAGSTTPAAPGAAPVTDALAAVIGDQPQAQGDQAKAFTDARAKRFSRYENAHVAPAPAVAA